MLEDFRANVFKGILDLHGKLLLERVSSNPAVVSDIDECAKGTHKCSADAVCNNCKGSHNCTCNPGYHGDGQDCQ